MTAPRHHPVADEARISRPVHSGPELLDDAGSYADSEINQEDLAEELVIRRWTGSFLISQAVCIEATRIDIPLVSGPNIK
jgi:hypothetical protein